MKQQERLDFLLEKLKEDSVQYKNLQVEENETAKKVFQAFAAFSEEDWKTVKKFIDSLKQVLLQEEDSNKIQYFY